MRRSVCMLCAAVCLVLINPQQGGAFVIINEILADPATGLSGDANADGVGHFGQDEFVELLNVSDSIINISNWGLSDAVKTRHEFENNTFLEPYQYVVVFGGGAPVFIDVDWEVASTGSLGLNNSSDIITLFDNGGNLVNQVIYGSEAGRNQSIVRSPEGEGVDWLLHGAVVDSEGRLYSPGTNVKGLIFKDSVPEIIVEDEPVGSSTVPEPASIMLMSMGLLGLGYHRKHLNV